MCGFCMCYLLALVRLYMMRHLGGIFRVHISTQYMRTMHGWSMLSKAVTSLVVGPKDGPASMRALGYRQSLCLLAFPFELDNRLVNDRDRGEVKRSRAWLSFLSIDSPSLSRVISPEHSSFCCHLSVQFSAEQSQIKLESS